MKVIIGIYPLRVIAAVNIPFIGCYS